MFPSILLATFQCFFKSPVYGLVPMTPFVTILSQLSIFSPFCHHFFTIYYETTETIQRRQAQSSDRGISQWDQKGHCCHWINEFFLGQCGSAVSNDNWCMWVCCSCTLAIGLKPLFLLKIAFLKFSYQPIGLKSQFQAQTGWFIMSHKVVTRKKVEFLGQMYRLKK